MSYSITVNNKAVSKDLKRFSERVETRLKHTIAEAATKIHGEATGDVPVHTGSARQGIKWKMSGLMATVWSGAKHSPQIEYGMEPGTWPSKDKIRFWVRKKLGVQPKRVNSVAFLVSRKIHDAGTDPQPFFEPAVRKWAKWFHRKIELLIKKA